MYDGFHEMMHEYINYESQVSHSFDSQQVRQLLVMIVREENLLKVKR